MVIVGAVMLLGVKSKSSRTNMDRSVYGTLRSVS